jgi:kynurenine formamidase
MCLPGTTEIVRARADEAGAARITRRSALGGAGAAFTAALLRPTEALAEEPLHWEDLTHVFREGFPVFTFDAPTRRTLVTVQDGGFYAQEWTFGEHSGTHMDAPGHFIAGGRLAPEITLEELFVPLVVIDISRRAARDPDAVVELRDLHRFESRHGRVPRRAAVCMYSGWEKRVDDPDAFKNVGADGKYHFPGFGIEATEWLLGNRDIAAIGVDTMSLDHGSSTTFDVHLALLGADKYGLENLANLKRIPPRGARAFVGLIPWEEGSGGPCRVVARF